MSRIFVYTSPTRGHLYPLVPTLRALRDAGHEISIRTLASSVEAMRELGFDAAPVDARAEAIENEDWRARTPIGAQRRDIATYVRRAPYELAEVRAALASSDALLIDCTAWGAATAAEASGLPWAMFAHFPLPIQSRHAPPYGLGLKPRSGALGRIRDALLRKALLEPLLERLFLPPLNELRTAEGLRPVSDATEFFARTAPLVLYYTAEPFEYPRDDWPPAVRLVGPGVWDPPSEAPQWFQSVQQPIVLVTCSSEFQNDGKLVRLAFELPTEEYELVVTTAGVDPEQFAVRPGVHVHRFLPHGPLLKRALCVVCHGGMGITQKALAAGVPVCAVPFGRDQFEVARRVEVAGAGTMIPGNRLSTHRLRAAVSKAIARRPGAQAMAAAFKASPGPSGAAREFERLMASKGFARAA